MKNLIKELKENRTYVDTIENERNKYRTYVLNIVELEYLSKYLKSESSEQDKADKLAKFCDYNTILHSISFYRRNHPNCRELILLKEIEKQYIEFDKKGLLFLKKTYKCTLQVLNERIEKLKKVDSILNSDKIDYIKVEELISLFENSEEFRKSYSLLIKYGNDDKRLDQVRNILNNFDSLYDKFKSYEDKGIIDDVEYLLSIQNYQKNYGYAKYIITSYIISIDSYKMNEFLEKLGINKNIFDYCVDTIEELDVDLYKKYLYKHEVNKTKRLAANSETIIDLANAIKTGYLNDGTKLDILEFIKRVPFKKSKNFTLTISDFMRRNNPKEASIIMSYIYKNGLNLPSSFKELNLNKLYNSNTKTIVKGVEITNKVKEIIIDYLKVYNIPLVNKAYTIVREKYINGEIDIEKLEQKKKELESKDVKTF